MPFPACDPGKVVRATPESDCEGAPDAVPGNGRCDLAPGTYGDLWVLNDAKLTLLGGTYTFCGFQFGRRTETVASAATIVNVHALPLGDAAAPTRDSVFAEEDLEGNVLQAVRTRSSKLITANQGNPRGLQPEELYDVAKDPGEQKSLVASEPVVLEEMRAALGRSYLEARAHAGAGAQTDVDSVTKDRLRALGYLD